jgi:Co/Zn/Cd efflux system component
VTSIAGGASEDSYRRIRQLQAITITWMIIEAIGSLWAAVRARSPALLAFGGDSAIELLSAAVVLRRFQTHASEEHAERRAARIAGVLLIILTGYVLAISALTLLGYSEPKSSRIGVAILAVAALVMPWLAR